MSYAKTFILGFSGFFIFTCGIFLGRICGTILTTERGKIIFNSLINSGELRLNQRYFEAA